MSVFGLTVGLFGFLILGLFLVAILPWAIRSIGESVSEFRKKPDVSDRKD